MKGLIFTYTLTFGGAVCALFNPFVGLLVYVCFAIIKPDQLWFYSVPQGNYSRIVALAALAGWTAKGFGDWQFGRATGVVWTLIGLQLWTGFGTIAIAAGQSLAWAYVESLLKIVLPFLIGITTIDSVRKLKLLAWVVVCSEGYLALEFNLAYFSGYNRLWFDGFGAMDNNCNAIALVACTGLAFFLGLSAEPFWQKGLAFGAIALMLHAVLFSFSRGGMLALIVTGVVSFVLMPKRLVHCLCLVAVSAGGVLLAGPQVRDRFLMIFAAKEQRDASAESRLTLWTACWDCMKQHPLGVGPGNWGDVVPQYGFEQGKCAHTLWLQVGAELGFPGLSLLGTFYVLCIARLRHFSRDHSGEVDPDVRWLAKAVIAAICGFAVAAQFVSLDLLEHPYYINLIGASLLKLHFSQPESVAPTAWVEESTQSEVFDAATPQTSRPGLS